MRTKNRLLVAAMVSALTLTSLTGCGNSSNGDKASSSSSSSSGASSSAELSGSVATDGSTSMEKVVGALGEAFMEANPDVKFTYNPTGSGSGITAVTEGRCDIGFSSRALTDDEKNQGLEETILAYDGIAIVVNPKNKVKDLKVQQIADITQERLRTGKMLAEIMETSFLSAEKQEVVLVMDLSRLREQKINANMDRNLHRQVMLSQQLQTIQMLSDMLHLHQLMTA